MRKRKGARTSIGITGEIARPLNECLSLVVAGRDREESNGAHDAGVAELRLGRDDGVGYVVVDRLSFVSIRLAFTIHLPLIFLQLHQN
jgi:hypothetical protein